MKVLIADDDSVSRRLLQARLLGWGYEVEVVADGAQAIEALDRPDAPRLAVVDWVMPGMSGIEVCRSVRSRSDGAYFYLILLTARGDKSDLVAGMEAGADDYVIKPWHAMELEVRVRAGARIVHLHQELLTAQRRLEEQALTDALTGIWNRRGIFQFAEREYERARRSGLSFSVVLADLDHFKRINDTYGHPSGDAVLLETANRFRATLRATDGSGRYGGEEFLLVLPETDAAGAQLVAERLRQAVCEGVVGADQLAISASFGTATSGDAKEPLESIIRRADEALYVAKSRGRNRVEMGRVLTANPAMGAPLVPVAS